MGALKTGSVLVGFHAGELMLCRWETVAFTSVVA